MWEKKVLVNIMYNINDLGLLKMPLNADFLQEVTMVISLKKRTTPKRERRRMEGILNFER